MRYFIELGYRGSAYHGWQRQPNAMSVQQVLEESLSKILRVPTTTLGCGRTDTGVHSSAYVAHFEYSGARELNQDFIYHLNSCLPPDIAVYRVYECDLHARFDALEREYQYVIGRQKDPFTSGLVWPITTELNTEAMQVAASKLLSYSDFTSFARLHSDNKTNICKITQARWEFTPKSYTFTIVADRFLRGMVRAIVGTLVDVGRDKISLAEFTDIIEAQDRAAASSAAPPDGLFLTRIQYKPIHL